MLSRRGLVLAGAAAFAGAASVARSLASLASPTLERPDHTIRIGTSLIELGRDRIVSTKTYNGQFPGPLLHMREGKRVVVDIYNDTDTPEQLHWHGQFLSADVDGAAEEGTPFVPARGTRRVSFLPGPSGFRFFHSHLAARSDLSAGLYSGQAGLVFVEPTRHPGAYDVEAFVTLKEFGPFLTRTEMPNDFLSPTTIVPELRGRALSDLDASLKAGRKPGFEVAYSFFCINGRVLGEGEPIRVRTGQRLLLHVLNASASEIRTLALPDHMFRVVALDGYEVPHPAAVPVLRLGPAERISATVEMDRPGVWVLGEVDDDARKAGMGIVVEYAGMKGAPQWRNAPASRWDYTAFGIQPRNAASPIETRTLTFTARPGGREGFDEFAINGTPFSMEKMEPMLHFKRGRRYRLRLRNATDDVHPLHLHRQGFELTEYAGRKTAGVVKDVVMLGGFQEMTVDFTADQPGLSLFHCHMQHHMDFGFMALFNCA